MKHDTPEELKRRLDKVEEKLEKQRNRSRRLRILLDTRTKKMVSLWGALEDIRRDVDRVLENGKPGDWPSLVQSVRKLVKNHVRLTAALSRESVRAALLEETLREEQAKSPGIFQTIRKWLRKGDPDGQ